MMVSRRLATARTTGLAGVLGAVLALAGCGETAPPASGGIVGKPTRSAGGPRTLPGGLAPLTPSQIPADQLHSALDDLTAYESSEPLGTDVVTELESTGSGVRVTGIEWASPGGGEVQAWLVEPPESVSPPYAGLVYVHGSETNYNDLRDEAEAMAEVGAVSLVISAPFARPSDSVKRNLESFEAPELERDMTAQAIVDVRRGYDLLAARADVDPARLGYVGHSWGASLGADMAAVDPRPVAVAMLAPRPSWTGFLATSDSGYATTNRRLVGDDAWLRYLAVMAPFDAVAQIGRSSGERLLLQYGRADDVVPPDVAQQLVDASPAGTTTQWFEEADHALGPAAVEARCAWLADRLGLRPVPADVLATVGLPDE